MPKGQYKRKARKGPRGPYNKRKTEITKQETLPVPKQVAQAMFLIAPPNMTGSPKLVSGPNLEVEVRHADHGSTVYKLERVGIVKKTATIE